MHTLPERALALDFLCRRLAVARDRLTIPLSRVADSMVKQSIWHAYSYVRASDFTREHLRRGSRWLHDLARLHRALCEFPSLAAALCGDDGERSIGRVAALRIGRLASPESVDAWIERARNCTVRELTAELRQAREHDSRWPPGHAPNHASAQVATHDDSRPPDRSEDEAEDEVRANVTVPVPAPVLAAFEEALDLHRAVVGREALVADFVEALAAESSAGDHSPGRSPMDDVAIGPVARADAERHREEALAHATRLWSELDGAGTIDPGPRAPDEPHAIDVRGVEGAVRESIDLLGQFDALEQHAAEGTAIQLVRHMRAVIQLEERIESQLGRVLAILSEIKAWQGLQFAGVGHYGAERLGMCRTTAEDRARLARGLRNLPLVRHAYREGRIGAAAALLLCRLLDRKHAHREVERSWVERAAQVTIRRLRDEVRVAVRCSLVGDRAHELDSRSAPEVPTPATTDHVALGPGAPPTPVAQRPTAAPSAGTVPFPVADRNWNESLQRAPGDGLQRITRLGAMAIERPIPDVFLRLRLSDDVAQGFATSLENQRRALEEEANRAWDDDAWDADAGDTSAGGVDPKSLDLDCGEASDARPSILVARMFGRRGRRPPTWVALLAMLEEYAHTWDQPSNAPRRAADAVYIRAGWRCTAPGCTSRKNLEDHHIVYRSRGGSNELSNRTCLCRFHHQHGEHGGLASVRGQAPLDIIWRLGRGELAHWYRNDRLLAPLDDAWGPVEKSERSDERPRNSDGPEPAAVTP